MNPVKDLGPCGLVFDNVDLGSTFGGVKFKLTTESKPVNEDQAGVTEVDGIELGFSDCSVEAMLTRSSLAVLSKVIKGSTYVGNKLSIRNRVGSAMYENAALLIIKPMIDGAVSTDSKTWINIPKAYPRVDMEVIFDSAGQRVYKVVFKAFPDAANNNELAYIGA
jgi:hypothetical protein